MVGVGQTPSDRSRTYWTPTMERFFIDLMLDQMHSGARIGHTFKKQAWAEMLAVFNRKFGSQYDKDVLKSRYTNLWKQFNDVKTLLAHNGFSWDEPRQMVVASDDSLWDSYIKTHPETRAYKTKAVLNFNELCVLYSYTTADGRYSRSSHDVDFDEEMHGMSIGGEGMYSLESSSSNGGGRQRTDWTSEMDHYFIELMLDQVGRGNKLANTFNKQAWADMLALFNAKFNPHHGKRVLRHRHKILSKYYSDVTLLLKQQGFSWSETQQMVVADDQVWDSYTKAHPHTRSYRTKSLPNYYDLILIFGNGFESGSNDFSNPEQNPGYNTAQQRISGGGKGAPVSDRTRTYWTPPMDRHLVDLLLDHVHRGNKIGQTFTSQAWTDMTASFNKHLKSCHEKDVLKNRYKHLRRQYNDMKLLLEQNGFSWDETREMILAEDPAWDAYTKVHPDARTYRVKTFPGFHKLCTIFGEEQFDGRYSRLARDSGLACEYPEQIASEDRNVHYACAKSSSINWTVQMDCFLMDLMSQQVQQGHKIDDMFDEHAWAFMLDSFQKSYGHLCNRHSVEDRYIWLKNQYESINSLLCCDGFMWDENQHMIIADDDIWKAYIKEHPGAVSYRNTCLSSYRDLNKIFQSGETVESINGQLAEMIFDDHGFEMIRDCHIPGTSTMEIEAEEVFCLTLSTEDICEFERQRKRSSPRLLMESGSGQCRKVQKIESENIQTLSEAAGLVAELVSKNEDMHDRPMVSAIDTLQAMPGLDNELLLDACDLLEDERKAKTFMALDASLRKKWLLRKLRPHS